MGWSLDHSVRCTGSFETCHQPKEFSFSKTVFLCCCCYTGLLCSNSIKNQVHYDFLSRLITLRKTFGGNVAMSTSQANSRFLASNAVHPSLPPSIRETILPNSYYDAHEDGSLSSATSTSRGRRRFRRIRSSRTQPGQGEGIHESGVRRRHERISPTGIAVVAIRVKDDALVVGSPIVSVSDQAQNHCHDNSDESSISSISSCGEDAVIDSMADDASSRLKEERNPL